MIALLILVASLAMAGATRAAAQKPPPGGGPLLGVSFDVTLTIRELGEPEELTIKLTGRGNITGEFEVRLDTGELDFDVELVSTGGRIYVRAGDEGWTYVDIAEIAALVGMQPRAGTPPFDSPECMQAFTAFAQRFQDPAWLLREIGSFQAAGAETIDGIPVVHYAGTVDLVKVAALFSPILENPACTGDQMAPSLDELLRELELDDVPAIHYDLFLGRDDQFPYRVRLLVGIEDEGEIELVANLRPSRSFFEIRAPQGAMPLPLFPIPGR